MFASLPSHVIVGMPALSPTMQTGSIAKWLLKEGDEYKPGTAICEVETDKAVVTYDATEEGVLAKILVDKGDITVGQPIMITVENKEDVSAFSSYTQSSNVAAASPPASPTPPTPSPSSSPVISSPSSPSSSNGRLFASPLAKTLAREAALDLTLLPPKGFATGPNGRIIAEDIRNALAAGLQKTEPVPPVQVSSSPSVSPVAPAAPVAVPVPSGSSLQELYTLSKRTVPHYYLSIDVDLSAIQSLRSQLNKNIKGEPTVSVQDFLVKSAARAMESVPEVNSSWRESFVRRYDSVDINFLIGTGDKLSAPLVRGVGHLGLSSISREIHNLTTTNASSSTPPDVGTFAIHNLGLYGVRAAAPIVLPPQACALSLGTIIDAVVPANDAEGQNWKVVPTMTVTLSCDHRVVDGAVGAAWLSAFKEYAQNPLTLLL